MSCRPNFNSPIGCVRKHARWRMPVVTAVAVGMEAAAQMPVDVVVGSVVVDVASVSEGGVVGEIWPLNLDE